MAEITTLARPYAVAVYRLAKQQKSQDRWSEMLALLAAVVSNEQMSQAIANPKLTVAQIASLLTSVCGDKLDASGVNLVKLLTENDKLSVLPVIAEMYETLKAEDGGVEQATIISATALDKKQAQAIVSALETRFKKKIEPQFAVDPELIGGVKIIVGDAVIDASVHAQLQDLAYTLKS